MQLLTKDPRKRLLMALRLPIPEIPFKKTSDIFHFNPLRDLQKHYWYHNYTAVTE
jgi:hypothetical protein